MEPTTSFKDASVTISMSSLEVTSNLLEVPELRPSSSMGQVEVTGHHYGPGGSKLQSQGLEELQSLSLVRGSIHIDEPNRLSRPGAVYDKKPAADELLDGVKCKNASPEEDGNPG